MQHDGEVKWIPVSAAAKALGVSKQRVYQLVGEGLLVAVKVDRTWLVSARSVDGRIGQLELEEVKRVA